LFGSLEGRGWIWGLKIYQQPSNFLDFVWEFGGEEMDLGIKNM